MAVLNYKLRILLSAKFQFEDNFNRFGDVFHFVPLLIAPSQNISAR